MVRTVITAILIWAVITFNAQSEKLEGWGTLSGINGECEFDQIEEKRILPFMNGLPGIVWVMIFSDSECSPEAPSSPNLEAAIFDQTQIARKIVEILKNGNRVNLGIAYDTNQLYYPGIMQSEGICIMDKEYPAVAVAIYFVTDDNHRIIQVEYTMTYGCGKPI